MRGFSILEAPDRSTRHSVESALKLWRFSPWERDGKSQLEEGVISGKLTFYFVNFSEGRGKGKVFYSAEAPNISQCVSRRKSTASAVSNSSV